MPVEEERCWDRLGLWTTRPNILKWDGDIEALDINCEDTLVESRKSEIIKEADYQKGRVA